MLVTFVDLEAHSNMLGGEGTGRRNAALNAAVQPFLEVATWHRTGGTPAKD
jgi:hypothetical protein